VRVSTEIGWFVDKVWVTEGIRPGVIACSHHLGRWRLAEGEGVSRMASALVELKESDGQWNLRQQKGVAPYKSSDPDNERIWWTDAGVHQNLTFPVQPDPVSGSHCWHQKVKVTRAEPQDRYVGKADGNALKSIEKWFGNYDNWENEFKRTGNALSGGSGWVILAYNSHTGELHNYWAADHAHNAPFSVPLLVMDMYEHAYQMDYGAAAAKYVDAFMQNVNWEEVNRRVEGLKL
jgi:hypothetical protein